ncbi:LysR family transcriptional regulator [Streptomyces cinnamoneus]|uniref:LysR family transcriptional regulator n=1 Tax=Streptomyces sp. NPDC053079 TaxID=3365697 RepID=UPI000904493D
MKLSQLAAFVAIADTGSFTKAAEKLGVTQSAVSHAMASLEAELRVGIMTRDRGGVDLTRAGQRIIDHARSALRNVEQIRLDAQSTPRVTDHRIVIGTSQSFSLQLLPRLISEFRSRFQNLEIVLREGNDTSIADMVQERMVDVGIVTLPKTHLRTYPLLQDEMRVVLPERHRWAPSSSLTVRRLAEEEILLPADGVEPTLRELFQAAGSRLRVTHRIQDLQVLLSMVAAGIGVTVLPSLALPAVLPDLRTVPFEPAVRRQLGIAVRGTPEQSSAVMAFVTTAQALARGSDWCARTAGGAVLPEGDGAAAR